MQQLFVYNAGPVAPVTDFDLPAVSDPQTAIQNGHYIWVEDKKVAAVAGIGPSLSRVKMVTPHFRAISIPDIRPIQIGSAWPTRPNIFGLNGMLPTIPKGEELQFLISTTGVGAERDSIAVWITDGNRSIPNGPIYTVRGVTLSVATVAFAWTNVSFTLDQTLPQGRYMVVGMDGFGTDGLFMRLVLPGFSHRPGIAIGLTTGIFMGEFFRAGNIGTYGEFVNTALPQLDIFATTAGPNIYNVWLDLIKIS